MAQSIFQGVASDKVLLTGHALAMEGVGVDPMPPSSRVLFHDTFEDGLYHGWRPVHMGGDRPFNPVSVETDYPFAGLFMATGSGPYRSGAFANGVSTYKGLSGRLPTAGVISLAARVAVTSARTDELAYDSWTMEMDIQNYTNTQRCAPVFACANPSDGNAPRWRIIKDDLSMATVGAADGTVNPVDSSLSGTAATRWLTVGENEQKWNQNYMRVSFDLGDLFTTKSTPTARYYEMSINGFRFDLRGEGAGHAGRSPQTGGLISPFGGGLNFGFSLYGNPETAGPARMVIGEITAFYHEEGWLP